MFDVNPAPDRHPHLETAIIEGGGHERSIRRAMEAAAFFDIADDDARNLIRTMAIKIAGSWREALRLAGVSGAAGKHYEPAFVHDEAEIAQSL